MSRALSLVRWSLLIIAVLLPWTTSNFTVLGFPYPLTANMFELPKLLVLHAGVTFAAVAWVVYLFRADARVRVSRWYALLAGAAALVLVSTALSGSIALSLFGRDARYAGALLFLDMAVVAWLSTQSLTSHEHRRQLAWALVASSALLSLYALMQFAGLDPVQWGQGFFDTSRPSATFGNPTILGGFLVVPLALALSLALQHDDKASLKSAAWGAATLIALGILVTFSRSAWIGALIASALIVVVHVRSSRRLARIDRWWVSGMAAVILLAILISLGSGNANTNVLERISSVMQSADSAGSRVTIWRIATQSIGDQPLLGAGPSTFRWEYASRATPEALTLEGVDAYADDAHSYPLHLAASVGLPAALLLLVFLGLVLGGSRRAAFARDPDDRVLLLAGYWSGTLGLLVHSAVSVTTGYLVVLWIAAGVLVSATSDVRPGALRVYRIAGIVLVGTAVISLGYVVGNARADALFMSAQMNADLGVRIALLEAAEDASPIQDSYPAAVGYSRLGAAQEALGRGAAASGLAAAEQAETACAHLAEGERAYQAAIGRASREPENYYQLAWLRLIASSIEGSEKLEEAGQAADQGLLRAPNSPRLLALKARILLAQGDISGALKAAEAAYAITAESVQVLTALGEVRLAAGDTEGARDAGELAANLAPDDPSVEALRARVEEQKRVP